ncbi:hypothetical protein BJV82DRAFT_626801 [Fennellomyces sp. T-0311]|nr:hypothetical protein BJV82DRAFT_626801 [Fennellomyces sp. T-0311]
MTPSFSYHPHQQTPNVPISQDMDFSPLTSPAILPQHSRESSNSNSSIPPGSDMTPIQIYEQYEQLERAKIMITRRLSELHKKRPREDEQQQKQLQQQQQQQQQFHRRISDHQQPLSPAGSPCIEPVTPASLMKIKSPASKPVAKAGPPAKKPRRVAAATPDNAHASPRALKPLLISPTLRPGPAPSPLIHDAEHILATRSNYQNLMEGKAAALGIAFSSNIKSGLEIRRTAHKAAEQKRRDSLKEWFDRLRREVEEGYVKQKEELQQQELQQQQQDKDEEPKPLSKVLLLKYAYEYISQLKETIEEKDQRIRQLEGNQ